MANRNNKTFRGHVVPWVECQRVGREFESKLTTFKQWEEIRVALGFKSITLAQFHCRAALGKVIIALRNEIKL